MALTLSQLCAEIESVMSGDKSCMDILSTYTCERLTRLLAIVKLQDEALSEIVKESDRAKAFGCILTNKAAHELVDKAREAVEKTCDKSN